MERMTLDLFGAWTELQSLMKDFTQVALSGDEAMEYAVHGRLSDEDILNKYKKVVIDEYGIAFPHVFTQLYRRTKAMRDKLAHFMWIERIEGDPPHRAMPLIRTHGFKECGDDKWIQNRYREWVEEQDLIAAIDFANSARAMLYEIHTLRDAFTQKSPPENAIWNFEWVSWWDGHWGVNPYGDGPWAPVGRYRHRVDSAIGKRYWHPVRRGGTAYRNGDAGEWRWFDT